jgi:ubiquitin-conjugating enzyme E2 J2
MSEENILNWYFLIKGIKGTYYEGGYYIGHLIFSPRYPETGPQIKMLTPSGRFEVGKTICLTNSHYHPESWTPAWNIASFVKGFESIMCSDDCTGISHITFKEGSESY